MHYKLLCKHEAWNFNCVPSCQVNVMPNLLQNMDISWHCLVFLSKVIVEYLLPLDPHLFLFKCLEWASLLNQQQHECVWGREMKTVNSFTVTLVYSTCF